MTHLHAHLPQTRTTTAPPHTQVRLLMLAALCGEHLLLLGPPGTAKSELSRRLSGVMGGQYFERLLTRFSVPEELFGPLSMKGACCRLCRLRNISVCYRCYPPPVHDGLSSPCP